MRKKIRCALSLLLLLCVLSGCGKNNSGNGLQTQPTAPNTSPMIPISTTAPTEPTDPTDDQPPSLEPVTRLTALNWQTVPQFLSLGNGNVLACRNDCTEGKDVVNYLDVFNVYDDTVLRQVRSDAPRELVSQNFPNGHFILREPQTNSFYIYNGDLQVVKTFTAPNVDGYFSTDQSLYYFIQNDVLYRMDIGSGNYGRMALQFDLRLASLIGMHPDRDVVIAKCYLSFYNDTTGICAIDCVTGNFLLLNAEASHLWFDGDSFYTTVTSDTVYGSDICYGNLTDGVTQRIYTAALGGDTASYTMLPGSGILLHRTVSDDDLSTTVYDLSQWGISSAMAQYGYETSTLSAIYLPQEQLIFGVYPQKPDFCPVVIDPKVLTYKKSLSTNKESWPALVNKNIVLDYQQQVQGPELPDELQAVRQQADALEQKYGITILMDAQTGGLCGSFAAKESDPAKIGNALSTLDHALSLYPTGFLGQFRNDIHEGGLYFCLTGQIQGALDPVGITCKSRNRYEIALDITADQLERTVHHELWHAIEMAVSTDSFDHPQWTAANPKDFSYYGKYDSGHLKLTRWTFDSSGAQCYFVDTYARINPTEDRARIMEYVMSGDASDLLRSNALHQKLSMMSKSIRDHFDTTGWQTPYWEQYL